MVYEINNSCDIQRGEFAKLKQQYKSSYPTIPFLMALKIEDIQQDEAVVVFIDFASNKIRKEKVPVSVLSNAF